MRLLDFTERLGRRLTDNRQCVHVYSSMTNKPCGCEGARAAPTHPTCVSHPGDGWELTILRNEASLDSGMVLYSFR